MKLVISDWVTCHHNEPLASAHSAAPPARAADILVRNILENISGRVSMVNDARTVLIAAGWPGARWITVAPVSIAVELFAALVSPTLLSIARRAKVRSIKMRWRASERETSRSWTWRAAAGQYSVDRCRPQPAVCGTCTRRPLHSKYPGFTRSLIVSALWLCICEVDIMHSVSD